MTGLQVYAFPIVLWAAAPVGVFSGYATDIHPYVAYNSHEHDSTALQVLVTARIGDTQWMGKFGLYEVS